jgi:hypothetical protein
MIIANLKWYHFWMLFMIGWFAALFVANYFTEKSAAVAVGMLCITVVNDAINILQRKVDHIKLMAALEEEVELHLKKDK